MSKEQKADGNKRYFSIIGGTLRTQVAPTHEEAVARDWESSDGKKGTKYEREVKALFGTITEIELHDGDFGKNLNITLDADEDGISPVISVGTATQYGEDLLKKLPSVSLEKEVRIRPFDFLSKEDQKNVRGVEVMQQDEEGKFTVKVSNFYYDADKKENKNGYPAVDFDKEGADSDDWKMYFTKARKFMVKNLEETVIPKVSQSKPSEKTDAIEYPENEGGEVPF